MEEDNTCDGCGYEKAVEKAWRLVTDVNDLAADDQIIIAVKYSNVIYALNTISGATITVNMSGTDAFTDTEVKDVNKITLKSGSTTNSWALQIGGVYVAYKSSTNFESSGLSNITAKSSWTITIATNGEAKIVNVDTTNRFIGFNKSSAFKAYSTQNLSTYPQPSIYKLS